MPTASNVMIVRTTVPPCVVQGSQHQEADSPIRSLHKRLAVPAPREHYAHVTGDGRSRRYVDPTEQLVTEIVVRDVRRSVDFYRALGFEVLRDSGDFVELGWEDHRLFLAAVSAFDVAEPVELSELPPFPLANVRVMVPDVDSLWARTTALGVRVVVPIGDRYYGLRDFTIADPDGFGIRFATLSPRR